VCPSHSNAPQGEQTAYLAMPFPAMLTHYPKIFAGGLHFK
jgi:hypothetical protein